MIVRVSVNFYGSYFNDFVFITIKPCSFKVSYNKLLRQMLYIWPFIKKRF